MTISTLEQAHAPTAGEVMVNGPEDQPTHWWSIDWRQAEDEVRRLRQRIFTASRAGDLKRVRNLQKLMLRSRANAQVSVRRVAELNTGRQTAGVDGKTALLVSQKADWSTGCSTGRPVGRPCPSGGCTSPRPTGSSAHWVSP
jgi:RNA-directed DNA polymerase